MKIKVPFSTVKTINSLVTNTIYFFTVANRSCAVCEFWLNFFAKRSDVMLQMLARDKPIDWRQMMLNDVIKHFLGTNRVYIQ